MISDNVDYKVDKNQDLGLFEATLSIALPTISVTRYKADRSDFKYEIFMFDTYKGDDFERAFRPYHVGTYVSSQLEHQPQTSAACRSPFFCRVMFVVVVIASQSAASLEPGLRRR